MLKSRGALSVVLAVLLLAVVAPAASAVPCGQPPASGGEATVGVLALTPGSVKNTTIDFKGDDDTRDLALILTVTGCTLRQDSDVKARAIGNESDAISFGVTAPKGDTVVLTGTVDPKKFKAGKHTPDVVVSSDSGAVKTATLEMTLQRKEPEGKPLALAVVALLIGCIYAFLLAVQNAISAYDKQKVEQDKAAEKAGQEPAPAPAGGANKVDHHAGYLLVAVVGAGGLAWTAYKTSYTDSATWAWETSSILTLFFAVGAAAAGGAAAGLLKGVTTHPVPSPPPPPPADGPAPAPAPAPAPEQPDA